MFQKSKRTNKVIFLDRDGTINFDKDYLYRIEDFEFIPGVFEGLRLLQKRGFLLLLITNQSGIARGYYTEQAFIDLSKWMIGQFETEGIKIENIYYCPHLPDAAIKEYRCDCGCRKPKLGMFEQAIQDYNIDLDNSYSIGDKIRDCAICAVTNCRGFLIGANEEESIIENVKAGCYRNVSYCDDLLACAKEIIHENLSNNSDIQ